MTPIYSAGCWQKLVWLLHQLSFSGLLQRVIFERIKQNVQASTDIKKRIYKTEGKKKNKKREKIIIKKKKKKKKPNPLIQKKKKNSKKKKSKFVKDTT